MSVAAINVAAPKLAQAASAVTASPADLSTPAKMFAAADRAIAARDVDGFLACITPAQRDEMRRTFDFLRRQGALEKFFSEVTPFAIANGKLLEDGTARKVYEYKPVGDPVGTQVIELVNGEWFLVN